MAALTLAQIRSTIRSRGDYQNVRKFPDTYLNTEIQKAFGKFWQIIDETHEGWWDTTADVSTVVNQGYAALPADIWRLHAVDRIDSPTTDPDELARVPINQRNRYGTNTGKPLAYRLTARGAELYPTPDGVYTLRLHYTPKAPSLAESQPREYYNGWEDYIIESVLLVLDRSVRLPTQDREAAVAAAEKALRSGATEHNSQEPEYLRLREFDDYDPFKDGLF